MVLGYIDILRRQVINGNKYTKQWNMVRCTYVRM
jgi:hypothetical protein